MIILGIDPGYAIVGYGVVRYDNRTFTPVAYGAVTTEAGLRTGPSSGTGLRWDLYHHRPLPARGHRH